MLYKLDSHSATFVPLYNSPNQDLGSEIVEYFENMELDSDPDLNFLVVAVFHLFVFGCLTGYKQQFCSVTHE